MLVISSIGYCQIDSIDPFNENEVLKKPQFKHKDFSNAIYTYFYNGDGFDFWRPYTPAELQDYSYYRIDLKFYFNSDGSVKRVSLTKSSGYDSLDKKVMKLAKNFARKKYMTPAYSKDGPIPYETIIQLDCKYLTLSPKQTNQPIKYNRNSLLESQYIGRHSSPPRNP